MTYHLEIRVTVSIGVTAYTMEDTLKTFIAKVDKALYEDKNDNRDSALYSFYRIYPYANNPYRNEA